jgi:aconitate hydratase
MKEEAAANDWPIKVEGGLIGSCTNSSYEDMARSINSKSSSRVWHYPKAEFCEPRF